MFFISALEVDFSKMYFLSLYSYEVLCLLVNTEVLLSSSLCPEIKVVLAKL